MALIIAFKTWRKVIFTSRGAPVMVGDALGMMQGATKFRSKDVMINLAFQELALLFAPHGMTLEGLHVWSEENRIADTLSRVDTEGGDIPVEVREATRSPMCRERMAVLGTRPAKRRSDRTQHGKR